MRGGVVGLFAPGSFEGHRFPLSTDASGSVDEQRYQETPVCALHGQNHPVRGSSRVLAA